MKKKILSLCLGMILIISGCGISEVIMEPVYAGEARAGYHLIPEKQSDSGVTMDSTFLLSKEGEESIAADVVKAKLQITPNMEFSVEQADKAVRIRPKEKLTENKIYAFSFEGATWLFQTESDFYLAAVLPADQATEVPVDSGIEFVFSAAGADELEKYIEILPKVEGKFESKGRTVAFVPKNRLEEKTVYTVRVKAGLPLANSEKKLKEEKVFQFETAKKSSVFDRNWEEHEWLSFDTWQNDIAGSDKPFFLVNYFNNKKDKKEDIKVKVDIYRYANAQAYIAALNEKANQSTWAYYSDVLLSTKELKKVMTLDQKMKFNQDTWVYHLEVPSTLPEGYYLVEIQKGKLVDQTFLQVTDISSFYQKSDTRDVLWLNKVKTDTQLSGAEIISYESLDKDGKVIDIREIERTKTDKDGLAYFEKKSLGPTALWIRSGEMESVLYFRANHYSPFYWKYWGRRQDTKEYWNVLQLDRNLYQPVDKLALLGYVAPRYEMGGNTTLSKQERLKRQKEIQKVQVEITQSYWYFYSDGKELAYVVKDVPVVNGFFTTELELPNLAQGSYQLRVKLGDEVIKKQHFTVEDYTKPAYKISVEKNKSAIFWNESIDFKVRTRFFEGTAVSHLDYSYQIGNRFFEEGKGKTDILGNGNFTYQYQAEKEKNLDIKHQYIDYSYASVYAKLPESGEIRAEDDFQVFLKNVYLDTDTQVKSGRGYLKGKVNKITLERMNQNPKETYGDFIGDALSGHKVDVDIYKKKWVPYETGQYYDYINKVVRKTYEWKLDEKLLESKSFVTDKDGQFSYERDMPKEDDAFYTATFTLKDLAGNPIEQNSTFWNPGEWRNPFDSHMDENTRLESNQTEYQIGETAEMRLMKGSKLSEQKRILYLTGQKGLRKALVAGNTIQIPFTEQDVPNLEVIAVVFEGYSATIAGSQQLSFSTEQKKLKIKATTDKESYRPGEEVKVLLEVTDYQGKAAGNGMVHIKAVDESLLALSDKQENLLRELYRHVSSGFDASFSSHGIQQEFMERKRNTDYMMKQDFVMNEIPTDSEMKKEAMEAPMASAAKEKANGEKVKVREKFLDTALFRLEKLDENGKATLRFTLPDNITSWRIMLSAISEDLQAGSDVQNLNVSLPFFINASLNKMYLTGDKMSLGVTAYGSGLTEGSIIDYTLYHNDKEIGKARGKAFTRINLPVVEWKEAGQGIVKVVARTNNGLSDALQYKVDIVQSYHQQEVSKVQAAKPGMKLGSNQKGMTVVSFVDREKAKYVPTLRHLNYLLGERIDQRFVAKIAADKLKELLGEDIYVVEVENIRISQYQKENGGLSILPYAQEEIDVTVDMLPLLHQEKGRDYINYEKVKMYLSAVFKQESTREKAKILYGLAYLGEPILKELSELEKISNLTDKDRLYIALSYAQLGDSYKAGQIYDEIVKANMEEFSTQASVKIASQDQDMNYYLSGLAMLLAQKLNRPEAEKFFVYMREHPSKRFLMTAHQLQYILESFQTVKFSEGSVSYSYLGQKREAKAEEYRHSVTIPSSKLGEFKIETVKGDMDVILSYIQEEKLAAKNDPYIEVKREYLVKGKTTNQFKEGDIIEVRLSWKIKQGAPSERYCITDYLPSGLKAINKNYGYMPYRWWQDVEGQKVTVYAYSWINEQETQEIYSYYARVVSTGDFKAEGTIMQNIEVKDHIFVAPDERIRIEEATK
ncbi:MAG: alpha-2-macroglobulin family protein [Eubacteriales bacterium]|nr:alpha-2-macroglobulin family protein [Eubacteriales bacterium]